MDEEVKQKATEKLIKEKKDELFISRKDYKDALRDADSNFQRYLLIVATSIVLGLLMFFFGADILSFFSKDDDNTGNNDETGNNDSKGKGKDETGLATKNHVDEKLGIRRDYQGRVKRLIWGGKTYDVGNDDPSTSESSSSSNEERPSGDLSHLDDKPSLKRQYMKYFVVPTPSKDVEGSSDEDDDDTITGSPTPSRSTTPKPKA